MIVDLSMPDALNPEQMGNKGATLAHLYQGGISVPYAAIIPHQYWQDYFYHSSLRPYIERLVATEHDHRQPLYDDLCRTVQSLPLRCDLWKQVSRYLCKHPEQWVAYRSSAVREDHHGYSFAGLLSSYLGCKLHPVSFEQYVKRVWVSLLRPATLRYAEHMLGPTWSEQILKGCAVLIQVMVPSTASGVCFYDHTHMRIESIYGLGLPLVAGMVKPDVITFNTHTNTIAYDIEPYKRAALLLSHHQWSTLLPGDPVEWTMEQRILTGYLAQYRGAVSLVRVSPHDERKAVLNDHHCIHLRTISHHIAQQLDIAQLDIEWTWNATDLVILQARPITRELPSPTAPHITQGLAPGAAIGICWSPSSNHPQPPDQPYVLCVPEITPHHIPYVIGAEGVLVSKSGLLSHGAILCRELNKPLVVCSHMFLDHLDGTPVILDGTAGTMKKMITEGAIL